MIYVGIDDTDMPDISGTNKFARALVRELSPCYRCRVIVRHQLSQDPRVPCTKHNSSASILFDAIGKSSVDTLIGALREYIHKHMIAGSDPGFCVAETVPDEVVEFGRRCQTEFVLQRTARQLAAKYSIHLEGCGGTNDGVIGALASIGLISEGNDGRVVQIADWPDDLDGVQDIATLRERDVEVRCIDTQKCISKGTVDIGKHLRPNYRENKIVLFARSESNRWIAVRLT